MVAPPDSHPTMKKKSFRILAVGLAVASHQLLAQTAPTPPDEAVEILETVAVTGSNVKRIDAEKVLPVTVFDRAAIEIRDAGQPADLLQALPQVTGLPLNETATLDATARGDNASISLRGIPSGNTLVLLNGRRLVPHPISAAEAGVPALSANVNQLPNRGLNRIDVLRDGASAIYGSDAVAGVVNYVMQRRFVGTELTLRLGETKDHDGQEWRSTLTHGMRFAKDKGRMMFTADFYHRAAIQARDRSFSADSDHSNFAPAPWNVATNTTFNARSATTEYGNFLIGTVTSLDAFGGVATFAGSRPFGVPATLASTTGVFVLQPDGAGGATFGNTTPSRTGVTRDYYWNNNAHRIIQPRSDRTNVVAGAEFDLRPNLTAFADASLYRAESVTQREMDGIAQSTDGFIIVPANNPYNPFGSRFWSLNGAPNTDGTPRLAGTPAAVSITNKRLNDLPLRVASVDTSVYRGLAGLRGKAYKTWTWEAGALYSAARVIDNEEGTVRRSLLSAAINQSDPAKAFNPFTRTFAVRNGSLVATGPYTNPESVTATFLSSYMRSGITKLGGLDFRAAGDVATIWGGHKIGGAFGGEFRYEGYDDYRPPYAGLNPTGSGLDPASNDFLGFSPDSDTHGNRHVTALYAEAVVPVIGHEQKLPLAHSLEFSVSGRYEDYTDFGRTTKPKYGVAWKPVPWVMVRASQNEGFRAPNLAQLFTGTLLRTLPNSTDTYRSIVTNAIGDGPSNRSSIASGNRTLKPETSRGKSLGVVVQVPGIEGLSLSLDYWEIRQKDIIASGGGIADDTAALLAATQAALASGKRIDQIQLDSGGPAYQGDPSVVRFPDTQADRNTFAAYNASQSNPGNQRAVVGAIDFIRSTYFNKAQQFLNGFDLDVSYRLPLSAAGQFIFNSNWSYLNDFHAYTAAGATRTDYRGSNHPNVGGATPVWRGSTNIIWRLKQWSAGVGHYYLGHYTDVDATVTAAQYADLGNPGYIKPVFNNGAYNYRYVVHDSNSYNLFVSYRGAKESRWLKQTSVRLGVNNLFDLKPPLSADSRGYDPAIYNVIARGRAYSLQVTKKF